MHVDVGRFPTLRSIKTGSEESIQKVDSSVQNKTAEPVADSAQPLIRAGESMDFSNVKIEPLFEDYVDFETFSKSDFRAVNIV